MTLPYDQSKALSDLLKAFIESPSSNVTLEYSGDLEMFIHVSELGRSFWLSNYAAIKFKDINILWDKLTEFQLHELEIELTQLLQSVTNRRIEIRAKELEQVILPI